MRRNDQPVVEHRPKTGIELLKVAGIQSLEISIALIALRVIGERITAFIAVGQKEELRLHHREALADSICQPGVEMTIVVRAASDAGADCVDFPGGLANPEERRAVGVGEVTIGARAAVGHPQVTTQVWVGGDLRRSRRNSLQGARGSQVGIRRRRRPAPGARQGRGKAHYPHLLTTGVGSIVETIHTEDLTTAVSKGSLHREGLPVMGLRRRQCPFP